MLRLHRYLLGEIARPLGAALLLLFQLLFAMQLLRGSDLVFGAQARASDVAHIAWLLLPHFAAVSLPIAFLLATLIGLGRLAEDRELLALGAAGVDPLHLLPVPLLLAGLLSLTGLALGRKLEPASLAAVRDYAGEMLQRNLQGQVKPGVFFSDLTGLTLYAQKVDPKTGTWQNVLVHDDRNPRAPLLVLARRGHLENAPGRAVALQLSAGQVHRARGERYDVMGFQRGRIEVGLGPHFFRHDLVRGSTEELTLTQLRAAAAAARGRAADKLWTAVARRSALPLAPLAFALLAVPLASRLRRGARTGGFVLAAAAFALYYVLGRAGQQWGEAGTLSPVLAAQLANLAVAGLGLALIAWTRRQA